MTESFNTYSPVLFDDVFLAGGCKIVGQVCIGKNSSIWHNTVLRADINKIVVGENTNIQELSSVHVSASNEGTYIGNNVTIGHNSIIHGCRIGDNCLIGMGSIILDDSIIGSNSLVAAGSIVSPGKIFKPNSFIIGSPARAIRSLTEEEILRIIDSARRYAELKDIYQKNKSCTANTIPKM